MGVQAELAIVDDIVSSLTCMSDIESVGSFISGNISTFIYSVTGTGLVLCGIDILI